MNRNIGEAVIRFVRKNPKANSTSNRKNGNGYNEIKAKRYSKNKIKFNSIKFNRQNI